MMYASALTLKGFPLAMPLRLHASAGRLRKKARVARRIPRNSSTWPAHETSSARAAGGGDVLVVARERALEAAGEPESAGHEEALRVVDVIDDLADAPLLRLVAVKRLLLGNAEQKRGRFLKLGLEDADDVVARDPIDVPEIVGRGFGAFRASHHAIIIAARAGTAAPGAGRLQHRGSPEAIMKRVDLTKPQFFFIVGTRAMLGAGIGLLAAGRFPRKTRRAVGMTLVAIGALTTIPAALFVFGGGRTSRTVGPAAT